MNDLESLRQDNMERFRRLQEQGVNFDGSLVLQFQFQSALDILLPVGTPEREEFELAFENRMASVILEAESQVLRAKLLQGVSGATPPLRAV